MGHRLARMDTILIILTLAHLMVTTVRSGSRAEYLSAPDPGITRDGVILDSMVAQATDITGTATLGATDAVMSLGVGMRAVMLGADAAMPAVDAAMLAVDFMAGPSTVVVVVSTVAAVSTVAEDDANAE